MEIQVYYQAAKLPLKQQKYEADLSVWHDIFLETLIRFLGSCGRARLQVLDMFSYPEVKSELEF